MSDTVSDRMVKPICSAPFSAAAIRRVARLDVPRYVLDHHDGVVHDESGGNGQGHQRQVIQAVAEAIHGGEGPDERERHGDARDDGGVEAPQEEEDDQHDEADREQQLELDVGNRCLDGSGKIGEGGHLDARRQVGLELGIEPLMLLTTLIVLAPGCRCTFRITAGVLFIHAAWSLFSTPFTMRATSVSITGALLRYATTTVPVVVARDQLIVGLDLVVLAGPVEVSFCGVDGCQG